MINPEKEFKIEDIYNKTKAILESLNYKPKTLNFLMLWINSNQYLTLLLLNYLIKDKLIELKQTKYYITFEGKQWLSQETE